MTDLQARRRSMPAALHTMPSPFAQPPAKLHSRALVRTWDSSRSAKSTVWDGLRRDPQLWFQDGDCRVFLYQPGQSRRGPSFQIPLRCLSNAQCLPLLSAVATASPTATKAGHCAPSELYIPAPGLATREDSFQWHLTTRNFFAWLCERPLVGRHLGQSLVDLLARMRQWRAPEVDCVEDILIYADQMQYSVVESSPDHALAMLAFAEANQLRNVWIDAFAHCVGMNNELGQSTEFETISRRTKALITRAYLEMDLHMDRATRSLGNFLEDELSATNLGLGSGARHHLDNFRSLLQTHHVAKYGYWPPTRSSSFHKELYLSMFADFDSLYNFLADKESSEPWRSNNGGICVQQTVDAFNNRQKYHPLPYSLPLLPQTPFAEGRSKSQLSLRAFVHSAKETASRQYRAERARTSLRAATNTLASELYECELLQRYVAFEDEQAAKPDGDVSIADARRVRWLLVYGVLQTLISIMSAPAEVRSTDTAPYTLCVLTDGIPPWEFESRTPSVASPQQTPVSATFPPDHLATPPTGAQTPPITIEPDCEADDFLRPYREVSHEVQSKRDSASLRKTVSRASFLRRASTLRKRSNSQPPPPELQAAELVSGRTLAELTFGRQREQMIPSSPTSKTLNAETKGETDSGTTADEPRSPTSDEMQLLLPEGPPELLHYESSDSSSVPSLAYSFASREAAETEPLELEHALIVNSHAGTKRIDEGIVDHGLEMPRGFVKIRGQGVNKTIHSGSLPRSVTKGYDYFDRLAGESSSGADTPDSQPGAVDRSAVIALDGNIDDETVEMYRSART